MSKFQGKIPYLLQQKVEELLKSYGIEKYILLATDEDFVCKVSRYGKESILKPINDSIVESLKDKAKIRIDLRNNN